MARREEQGMAVFLHEFAERGGGEPVHIGRNAWIGAGATIIQGVKIGRWTIIGAGSVVTKDIPDGYVAYGTPCHRVRRINQELLEEPQP